MAKSEGAGGPKPSKRVQRSKPESSTTASFDPNLTDLFNSSAGKAKVSKAPFQSSQKEHISNARRRQATTLELAETQESDDGSDANSTEHPSSSLKASGAIPSRPSSRKRKREVFEDDLEERYLRRLETEAVRVATLERQPPVENDRAISPKSQSSQTDDEATSDRDSDRSGSEVPQHETITQPQHEDEVEKASRTVFLGNVSTSAITSKAARRSLDEHLTSFLPDLSHDQKHKVESLRFRSTAFADTALPKKASFVKKEVLDTTTHSTNAYVVYSTQIAAREAVKRLNATIVLDRHLRVDGVAHPSKVDHRRCVFVGNLGFVDDESNIKAAETAKEGQKESNKKKPPADVEEGLWRQFSSAGAVESVRVVRDKATRVGKGFAYVQFENPNSVEKALLFNDHKYPPMLPRKLRVTRAKKTTKSASKLPKGRPSRTPSQTGGYQAKPSSEARSLAGRAGRLFGQAGAQKYFKQVKNGDNVKQLPRKSVLKAPEDIVFEGHRAKPGTASSKLGKAKKGGRRTKRSTAFRSRMRKG